MTSKKIIWTLVLILLVTNIYGFGMAPARTTYDFEPNTVKEGYFRIVADEIPTKVVFVKEGETGRYIDIEEDVMILENKETWISFKLNLPTDLPPGERKGGILVMQVPSNTDSDVIMAAPALIHQVRVKVPFPGKYMTGTMFITNTRVNEPVIFTTALTNWGKETIENAKGTIIIKGPTNEEIAVLHTDQISLTPNQEKNLLATWTTENSGDYIAEMTVEYDGKILKLTEPFSVGNLEIEIERVQVDNFKIGQIAKLDIYLRNKWNKPFKVDGRVEIFKDNKLVSTFNTIPVTINEKSTAVMNAYWNTEDIEVGEYDISVKATYEGKISEKTFSSVVAIDKIQFKEFVSGKVITGEKGNNTTILIIAVFMLILVNIFLFIYIKKKLKS